MGSSLWLGITQKAAEWKKNRAVNKEKKAVEKEKKKQRKLDKERFQSQEDTQQNQQVWQQRNYSANNPNKFWDKFKWAMAGVAGSKLLSGQGGTKKGSVFDRLDIVIVGALFLYFLTARYYRANLGITIPIYVFITLVLYLFLLQPSQRKAPEIGMFVGIVWAVEVGLPGIIYEYMPYLLSNFFIRDYVVNPQVTLGWFYFGVFYSSGQSWISWLAKRAVMIFWVILLFSFIMNTMTLADVQTVVTPEQIAAADSLYIRTGEWGLDMLTGVKNLITNGVFFWEERFAMATGDYYTGSVDENQYENLGGFLEYLRPADPQFYAGEDVIVWAMLQARTLDDGLAIDVNCYHGKKLEDGTFPYEGDAYPAILPRIYDEEEVDLDCRFPYGTNFEEGSNSVTVQADFHFETMAYLKTYFMDKDNIRAMERNGMDPLDEFGIEDKNPIAKYTNGPVKIGMGPSDPPIGLGASYPVNPRLSITLTTNDGWKGKIKQVEELMIMLPESMSLDTTFCPEFDEIDKEKYPKYCKETMKKYVSKQMLQCIDKTEGLDKEQDLNEFGDIISTNTEAIGKVEACMEEACKKELEGYNVYNLTISKNDPQYQDIGFDAEERKYKTLSCRINLDNQDAILGNAPISTQYFRTKAKYIYQIEEETHVEVREDEDTTNYPRPSKSGVANLPFVYNTWHKQINESCETKVEGKPLYGDNHPFFKTREECMCYYVAIINQESRGDATVESKAGSIGLMQVLPSTASSIVDQYKLTPARPDLYNPEDNMKIATYLFHALSSSQWVNNNFDYFIAAYNGGECGYKQSKGYMDGALCSDEQGIRESCRGKNLRFYQCEEYKGYAETRAYVPSVKIYYEACQDLQFEKYTKIEEVESPTDFLSGTKSISLQTQDKKVIDVNFKVDIFYSEAAGFESEFIGLEELDRITTLTLYYRDQKLDKITVPAYDKWLVFEDYPFVRYKASDDNVEFQTWKPTTFPAIKLIEKEKKVTSDGTEKKYTELWKKDTDTYLYAYYDGDITLYDENKERFCTIYWERDSTYGFCDEEVPGFMAIRQEVKTNPEFGEPYTIVQFKYDPGLEYPCCNTCEYCTREQCVTCKNCEPNDYDNLDLESPVRLECINKPESS